MRIRALFSPAALLILVSCDGGTPVDIFDIQGVVLGTVRTATGAPVPGAVVKGSASYPLVSASMSIPDSTQTDASGEYTLHFMALNLADADAPVALQVSPPNASGLLDSDTSGFTVRIARSPNTTRVDVTLLEDPSASSFSIR